VWAAQVDIDIAVVVHRQVASTTKRIHHYDGPELVRKGNTIVVCIGYERCFLFGLATSGQDQNRNKEFLRSYHRHCFNMNVGCTALMLPSDHKLEGNFRLSEGKGGFGDRESMIGLYHPAKANTKACMV